MPHKRSFKLAIIFASLLLYILSFTQDAFVVNDMNVEKVFSSLEILVMGGIAFLGGGLLEQLILNANPLYVLTLVFFLMDKPLAIKTGLGALVLAALFLTWNEILVAESCRTAVINSLAWGYWLWLGSITSLCIGVLWYFYRNRTVVE
jgi:hypothetical protein